jgi:arylsulfatase A-like enzyme
MKTIFCITGLAIQGLAMSVQAQTGKPNIVVIMTDQQRADLCGREGFPLEVTPFVDRLAQENVWFNKAYTVMPASSPARCSMFTGRFPSATHVRTNHNIPDISYQQDLVGVLKENGYKTALVGKNHAYLKPADLDFWSEYGHWGKHKKTTPAEKETARFLNQQARGQWLEPSPISLEEQHPTKIVNEALAWIKQQKENPFFVWVSFPEPHNPYQVCEPYYSMFSPDKLPVLKTSRKDLAKKGEKYRILAQLEDASCPNLEQDLPRIRANYIGMIRLIDDQIKRLIESLKASGQYENTIFVELKSDRHIKRVVSGSRIRVERYFFTVFSPHGISCHAKHDFIRSHLFYQTAGFHSLSGIDISQTSIFVRTEHTSGNLTKSTPNQMMDIIRGFQHR